MPKDMSTIKHLAQKVPDRKMQVNAIKGERRARSSGPILKQLPPPPGNLFFSDLKREILGLMTSSLLCSVAQLFPVLSVIFPSTPRLLPATLSQQQSEKSLSELQPHYSSILLSLHEFFSAFTPYRFFRRKGATGIMPRHLNIHDSDEFRIQLNEGANSRAEARAGVAHHHGSEGEYPEVYEVGGGQFVPAQCFYSTVIDQEANAVSNGEVRWH
nr:hypothetical protein Iba_chr02aCG13480 [Ipomoea batatas]